MQLRLSNVRKMREGARREKEKRKRYGGKERMGQEEEENERKRSSWNCLEERTGL